MGQGWCEHRFQRPAGKAQTHGVTGNAVAAADAAHRGAGRVVGVGKGVIKRRRIHGRVAIISGCLDYDGHRLDFAHGPPLLAHLMNGIEQQEILNVGEFFQQGGCEGHLWGKW